MYSYCDIWKFRKIILGLFLGLVVSCEAPEFSPWQKNIRYKDLTAENIAKIKNISQEPTPFKVAFVADPQAVTGHLKKIFKIINLRDDIDFIVIAGDITDLGLKEEWEIVGDFIEESNKPVVTVVGNHDGLSKGKDIYQRMFGAFNYSFVHKGVKFVFWNNNYYEWGDPDYQWLMKETESHPFVTSVVHQPPYSGTLDESQEEKWRNIRNQPNHKITVAGHLHHFSKYVEKTIDKPVFVIDRVDGSDYGVIEFNLATPEYHMCRPICEKVE